MVSTLNITKKVDSDLRCCPLLLVGGCRGCDVTYRGRRVGPVASSRSARLRRNGGGRNVADQSQTALHFDVRVSLSRHLEDAEAVVIKARHLSLEHGYTPLVSANSHRRLAVEDGQLPT